MPNSCIARRTGLGSACTSPPAGQYIGHEDAAARAHLVESHGLYGVVGQGIAVVDDAQSEVVGRLEKAERAVGHGPAMFRGDVAVLLARGCSRDLGDGDRLPVP